MRKTKDSVKASVLVLCVLLMLTLFLSLFYIDTHAKHHCEGEDCPVCMELKAASVTIAQISMWFIVTFISICLVGIIQKVSNQRPVLLPHKTLITYKVRLND